VTDLAEREGEGRRNLQDEKAREDPEGKKERRKNASVRSGDSLARGMTVERERETECARG